MTEKIQGKVPPPFTRAPIPPAQVQVDRKKKHPRQDKHKGKSDELK